MNREKNVDESGKPYIRLIATTDEEKQILKDLVVSRARWLEFDLEKGYIDLVDEVFNGES